MGYDDEEFMDRYRSRLQVWARKNDRKIAIVGTIIIHIAIIIYIYQL